MYSDTKETLERVSGITSSHQGEHTARTPKTRNQQRGLKFSRSQKMFTGIAFAAVALAVGMVQYKENRTNVPFDTSIIGVGMDSQVSSIRDSRIKVVESNMEKLDKITERNSYVANDVIDSMSLVSAQVTATSYVKVSPNHMVNVDVIDESGKLLQEAATATGEVVQGLPEAEVVAVEPIKEAVPGPLLEIASPDENYTGEIVEITGQNRANLESLVFNEAGNQGFIGTCLVAQAIRDQMLDLGIRDTYTIKRRLGYEAAINGQTNEHAKQAVSYIFDHGGIAVQHRIYYFYSPRNTRSSWHETQNFVVEYKGHRVFDKRG